MTIPSITPTNKHNKRNTYKRKRTYGCCCKKTCQKYKELLLLQGGGALGAYEVGVIKALYEKLTKEDNKNGYDDVPLFDIIAGTSIWGNKWCNSCQSGIN